MTHWMYNYHGDVEFMQLFETEQDFIDAMFVIMILCNFGTFLSAEELAQA